MQRPRNTALSNMAVIAVFATLVALFWVFLASGFKRTKVRAACHVPRLTTWRPGLCHLHLRARRSNSLAGLHRHGGPVLALLPGKRPKGSRQDARLPLATYLLLLGAGSWLDYFLGLLTRNLSAAEIQTLPRQLQVCVNGL